MTELYQTGRRIRGPGGARIGDDPQRRTAPLPSAAGAGCDLTSSVPKSVSVVYALGDPLMQAAVVDAGRTAVAEALSWLEREACHVRLGTNNRAAVGVPVSPRGTRRLPGPAFAGTAFRHRTSRAGDPQLHWHVLVATVTRGGGRSGIRTHGGPKTTTAFEAVPFVRSGILPGADGSRA